MMPIQWHLAHSRGDIPQVGKEEIMPRKLLFVMVLAMILGCATSGRKFDTSAVDRMVVGKTTESQVIAMLGTPESITRCSNGIDIYYYTYAESGLPGLYGTLVDNLEVQVYSGLVRNTSQRLYTY
jgi:hypothetical protein